MNSPIPSSTSSADAAGFFGALFVGTTMFLILGLIFWLLALIDILKSEFKDPSNKVVWLVVTLLLPFLGPILYFLIGRKQVKKGSGISLKVFFTIILFFIWYPLAVLLMWFWTNWPKWVKILITIVAVLMIALPLFL